jgi:hypothetical protein
MIGTCSMPIIGPESKIGSPMLSIFLWLESPAWSSIVSARFAKDAVRTVGEIEFNEDHSISNISPIVTLLVTE